MIFLLAALLFIVVLLGGALAAVFLRYLWVLKYFLVFTGAYLLTITLLHFLPELYATDISNTTLSLCILGGFFLQHSLEQLTGGIEHGHMPHASLPRGGVPTMCIGLGVHALLEGMIITQSVIFNSMAIFLSILLHKVPASFAFTVALRRAGLPLLHVWGTLVVFALASPIGMFLGLWGNLDTTYLYFLLAVVAGLLLHLATRMLLEGTPNHKYDAAINTATAFGIGLGIVQQML